ncbi:Histone acetyltransferase complex subunit [Basidiobolus ranarum]|uniref:Histone acetyltransferase complex subunit n=1 Tax=Basidiobolus ranarum TaxID=34480 RepID=A0ABR2WPB0_9FUNG
MEDAGVYLQEFISSLDNLPSEVQHLMTELEKKDAQYQDLRRQIQQRDRSVQGFIKTHGYQVSNPQEKPLINKIQRDFTRAQEVADEKIHIAERALELVEPHIYII